MRAAANPARGGDPDRRRNRCRQTRPWAVASPSSILDRAFVTSRDRDRAFITSSPVTAGTSGPTRATSMRCSGVGSSCFGSEPSGAAPADEVHDRDEQAAHRQEGRAAGGRPSEATERRLGSLDLAQRPLDIRSRVGARWLLHAVAGHATSSWSGGLTGEPEFTGYGARFRRSISPAGRGDGSGRRSRRCCRPARWPGRTPPATPRCGRAGAAGRRGWRGRRGSRRAAEPVDLGQRDLRAVELGDRDRPVEPHDRRGVEADELVVERDDLRPVGVADVAGVGVDGVDRGEDLVATRRLARRRGARGPGRGPRRSAPRSQAPRSCSSRVTSSPLADTRAVPAGLGQEHQRQQSGDLAVRPAAGHGPAGSAGSPRRSGRCGPAPCRGRRPGSPR